MKSGLFGCMCVSCGTWCSLCSTSRQPQNISNQIVKTWKDFNGNYWFLDSFSKKHYPLNRHFSMVSVRRCGMCNEGKFVWDEAAAQLKVDVDQWVRYSPITWGWLLSQQEPMATSLLVEGGLSFSFKMWCSQSSRQFIGIEVDWENAARHSWKKSHRGRPGFLEGIQRSMTFCLERCKGFSDSSSCIEAKFFNKIFDKPVVKAASFVRDTSRLLPLLEASRIISTVIPNSKTR